MMNKFNTYNLPKSFYFAVYGILRSFWHERNLRIHFFVAAYILYFSHYFNFTRFEYALIFIIIGIVIACELINTAIESAVDLNTPVYSDLAKIAKDAAAGAVLVSAIASFAVGVVLFWQPIILRVIWNDIVSAPLIWLFLFAVTIFFIAWPEHRLSENSPSKNNPKEPS